jgi:hypothetical protein
MITLFYIDVLSSCKYSFPIFSKLKAEKTFQNVIKITFSLDFFISGINRGQFCHENEGKMHLFVRTRMLMLQNVDIVSKH